MCTKNVDTNALVRKYEPLIHSVIAKKLPKYIGDEDLVQVGRIALWKCAKRFDPDKGKFSTYAFKAIYHSMLDELGERKSDVSLNAPVIGEEELELQDTIADLRQDLNGLDIKFELEDFMKTLTDRQQTILKLKCKGQTKNAIQKILSIGRRTLFSELRRIKTQWKIFHNTIEEE